VGRGYLLYVIGEEKRKMDELGKQEDVRYFCTVAKSKLTSINNNRRSRDIIYRVSYTANTGVKNTA